MQKNSAAAYMQVAQKVKEKNAQKRAHQSTSLEQYEAPKKSRMSHQCLDFNTIEITEADYALCNSSIDQEEMIEEFVNEEEDDEVDSVLNTAYDDAEKNEMVNDEQQQQKQQEQKQQKRIKVTYAEVHNAPGTSERMEVVKPKKTYLEKGGVNHQEPVKTNNTRADPAKYAGRWITKKPQKNEEEEFFREMCVNVNKISSEKIVTMISDIAEGIEYPIDIIKCFLSKNEKAVVTVEFDNRILYLPYLYRNYFLNNVFCMDNKLKPLQNKTPKLTVKGNEIQHDKLFFRVQRNPETNYTQFLLLMK